ncbi:hypothetical protein BHM03_00013016, partial [Ensete ventricosum]
KEKRTKRQSWPIAGCSIGTCRWGSICLVLDKERSHAPHGGPGALPSAGGSPSDLPILS